MGGEHAGAAFGPYRIEELISQSATASVYRATDGRHGGRTVALKLFAPHLSADPTFRERFRQDAGLLSAVRDPHVVPVHTYGVHEGIAYLDMRFVRGRSLAEAQRSGGLDAARVPAVISQLDAAIGAVRAGGLGDRHVSAADVLLSGPPGREFVHVVGLGLGRPSTGGPTDVAGLVGPPAPPPRPRRRLWWPAVAIAATLALAVGVLAWTRVPEPTAPLAPGQIAALTGGGPALAAATTVLDGTPVVVVATGHAIRTWSLTTGRSAAPVIEIDARAVATVEVDGEAAVVSRSPDQLIHVHRLSDGEELGGPIGVAEPAPPPGSMAANLVRDLVTTEVDGHAAVIGVQASESDWTPELAFAVWRLPAGDPVVGPVSPGPTVTLDLAAATVDGRALVVALGARGPVQAYDASTGRPVGNPIAQGMPVEVIDVVDRESGPVVVTGSADNSIRVFDLRTGAPIGPVLRGHVESVRRVAVVRFGGRDVVVSTAGDRLNGQQTETRFWELDGATPVGPVLATMPAPLTTAEVDGRGLLVTSTPDGAAVWDLAELIGEGAR